MIIVFSRRDFIKQAAIAVPASGLFIRAALGADNSVIAETTLGKIRGVDEDGIKTFKGIPYGASTAGTNRFLPPQLASKWTGVRDTIKYGYTAPQLEPGKPGRVYTASGVPNASGASLTPESEDCLVLNVWTPALHDGKKRPVMFWCHGGGFSGGSGSSPITAGHNLAKKGDVVIVTVNHRLNVLGFTNIAAVAGSDFAGSGNAGMLDLVMALTWVKDNIAQFGGDPSMVTIFGQSGGGRKVATLLAMPSATGLFNRAIIESGPTIKQVDAETGEMVARALIAKLGLDKSKARDIQNFPVDKVMTAYFVVTRDLLQHGGNVRQLFAPNVDGKILPQHPFYPVAAPSSANVPVMIGNCRTEVTGTDELDEAAYHLTDAQLQARVGKMFGADAIRVIDTYKKANPGVTPSEIFILISSDHAYGAAAMMQAQRRAALGKAPVYEYYFRWKTPLAGGRFESPHALEVSLVFDTVETSTFTAGAPTAQALADKVSDAWLAFAKTGNPNVASLPQWPAFDAKNRPTMIFNDTCKVVNDPLKGPREVMFDVMKM